MIASLNRTALLWLLSASIAFAQAPHETGSQDSDDDTPPPVIQESAIGKPSLESTGTLNSTNGGLSSDIWKNSSRANEENLLIALHSGGIADETVRALTLRALMTQADPPPGTGAHDWFLLRIETLMLLGQDDKADSMISAVPNSLQNDTLRKLHAQLWLIRGETNKACVLAASVPKDETAGEESIQFWQKMNITCQAVTGKMDDALVGIDMLRETYHTDDLFFLDAIHAIGDKKSTIKSLPKKWSLFDVALVHLAGQTDKLKDKLDVLPPLAIKYLALDTTIDVKLRERATAKAENWGLVPTSVVNTVPEQPFAVTMASDVTSLVRAISGNSPPSDADNRVIARLAIDENVVQDIRRIERLLAVMEPLGYTVPAAIWQKLWPHRFHPDIETPSASLLARLDDAMQAKRTGEVIILSALIVGNTSTEKASELTLVPVIRALVASGFTTEARQVASRAVKNYGAH